MFARTLTAPNLPVRLVVPVVTRDSALSVRWLTGGQGRETLQMMGVPDDHIAPASLEEEVARIASFLDRADQYNWMIELDGTIVGAIWVDLRSSAALAAPAVSYMVGDLAARGKGVAGASLAAVTSFMSGEGFTTLHARALVTKDASARVLFQAGFATPTNRISIQRTGCSGRTSLSGSADTKEAMIRRIPFQGALNFRDIGGYLAAGGFQTRWGLIYRSDSLHFLTAADLPEFDALGVRSIYDLRRASDLRDHPGPREHIHVELPSCDPAITGQGPGLSSRMDGENWLLAEYRTMLASAATSFGNLFARLSQDTRLPAVIHCVGGKDRTGLAVALLLTVLGVDRELVLDDYQLTDEYRGTLHLPHVISLFVTAGLGQEAAEAVLSSPRWAMAAALDEVNKTHGGIENYLLGAAGMTSQTLAALKDTLLCRSP